MCEFPGHEAARNNPGGSEYPLNTTAVLVLATYGYPDPLQHRGRNMTYGHFIELLQVFEQALHSKRLQSMRANARLTDILDFRTQQSVVEASRRRSESSGGSAFVAIARLAVMSSKDEHFWSEPLQNVYNSA